MIEAFKQNLRRKVRGFRILAASMFPTLWVGDQILVDFTVYQTHDPRRKDIVVFLYPEDETKIFVKRVIGLPGDEIMIRSKVIYVNGCPLDDKDFTQHIDPNIIDGQIIPRDNFGLVVILKDSYFMMGDNRDQSLDSRFWGFVKREKILGKAEFVYFSIDKLKKEIRFERGWKKIK